ncbi:AAA family ATPase [Rhizobium leguminosarum]|uniref:AAA family ATPase n=1 Tax=Rhizobium leguminosarum TaxID=384 RepID=UPI0024A7D43E|nr:AAA family ATPase [Rhizobium leguminosarum]MDI5929609.1 AAA family ATPase [Rhizobium leguminosarum]
MTSAQPKPDPRPHRTAFYQVNELAHQISGDIVLVPDASNLTGINREDLIKLSHWENKGDEGEHLLTPDNIDRLAVLTDGFFRFMDDGKDASVITLWRSGTPIVQQIDGEPCEAAVELVTDAVTGMRPLREKWHGLPPLEAEMEILACRAGFIKGHRPKWLERQARRNLEERDVDPAVPDEPKGEPVAANDNVPAPAPKPDGAIHVINPADWHGEPVPTREWYCDGLIPMRTVTILNGDGGVGKSLLALQLAAAGAMGLDTLGMEPLAGRTLVLGAEDDADEFQRRLDDIAKAHGKDLHFLSMLRLIALADRDALLSVPDRAQVMQPTPLWRGIETYVRDFKPKLIILDTAADLFGGDEIKRSQVRQFIAMLRKLAMEIDCAVVLLAHPSVQGMQSGTGSSGSTAWNNSVRSRLYLTKGDKDADPDIRILKTMKANYGKTGDEIRIKWKDGVFIIDDGKPKAGSMLLAAKAERVFRDVLSAINRSGERVAKTKGINYAPKIMADRPDAEGMSAKQLEGAMQRLLVAGDLRVVMEGPASKQRQRLILTSEDFGPKD